MAEHFQPPDPKYRQWATGAPLLEMHAITGAWAEFQARLAESPELATNVSAWICLDDDTEYPAFEEAKRLAASIVPRRQVD